MGVGAEWRCLVACGPCPWGPGSSITTDPSGKGTGVAEVAKGELPAGVYRWPFPCPGLPHHGCLPDPAESQGAARLKVTCLQEPRFGREATDPHAPASRTRRSLWGCSPRGSCRTGPLPPGRSHCAMLLPGHQALAPSPLFSPGTLYPGCRARLELLKAFSGAGVDWATRSWQMSLCLCSATPFPVPAPVGRRYLADESETTSGVGA